MNNSNHPTPITGGQLAIGIALLMGAAFGAGALLSAAAPMIARLMGMI